MPKRTSKNKNKRRKRRKRRKSKQRKGRKSKQRKGGVKLFKDKPGITRRLRPIGNAFPIGTRVVIRTAIQDPNSSGWHTGIIVAPAESNGQEMGQLVKIIHLGYINWIPLRKIALDTPALREYIKHMFKGIHKKSKRRKGGVNREKENLFKKLL